MNQQEFEDLKKSFESENLVPEMVYLHLQDLNSKDPNFRLADFMCQYIYDNAQRIALIQPLDIENYNSLLIQAYRWASKNNYDPNNSQNIVLMINDALKNLNNQSAKDTDSETEMEMADESEDDIDSEESIELTDEVKSTLDSDYHRNEADFLEHAKTIGPLAIYKQVEQKCLQNPKSNIHPYVLKYIVNHTSEIQDYILNQPISNFSFYLKALEAVNFNHSFLKKHGDFVGLVLSHSTEPKYIKTSIAMIAKKMFPEQTQEKMIANIKKNLISFVESPSSENDELVGIIQNYIYAFHNSNDDELKKEADLMTKKLDLHMLLNSDMQEQLIKLGYNYAELIESQLHAIKQTNPSYYKDFNNWEIILLSSNNTEIDNLINYVSSSRNHDLQEELARLIYNMQWYHELLKPQLSVLKNKISDSLFEIIQQKDISTHKKNAISQLLMILYGHNANLEDLKKINTLLNNFTLLNSGLIKSALNNINMALTKLYQDNALTAEDKKVVDGIVRTILIKTEPDQVFKNDSNQQADINSIIQLRSKIAMQYYQFKTTEYTHEDWAILSQAGTLLNFHNNGINVIQVINNAINHSTQRNENFYHNKETWLAILLSGNQQAIDKLNNYVLKSNHYDIAYLARLHDQITIWGLSDSNIAKNERTRLLKLAAMKGNQYAFQKLAFISSTEDYAFIKRYHQCHNEIDDEIAFLQDARTAKGLRGFQYLLQGSKGSIANQIQSLKNEKKVLDELAENPNSVKEKEFFEAREQHKRQSKKQKKLAKTSKTALNVITLGTYNLYRFVQNKIGNKVLDSSPMKGSAYQFWQQNYNLMTDIFNVNSQDCFKIVNTKKEELKQAQNALQEAKVNYTKCQQDVNLQKKTTIQELFKLKTPAEKALSKADAKVKEQEKNVHRATRDINAVCLASNYRNVYPGLEIEERRIITEDGKHLDVLIINNKAAQRNNGGKAKDLIHFSGSACFYQLETRHFDHAIAKGCNLIVVQDRLKSTNSYAQDTTKNDLAKDGCAAVKNIMEMRKQEYQLKGLTYEDTDKPIIHGYCGGGPISLLTHEKLAKEGIHLKYIADRTFKSTSDVVKSMYSKFYAKPKKDKDTKETFIEKSKTMLVNNLTQPALVFFGWETNNAKKIAAIPEHQKIHVDIKAPNDPNNLYHDDYVLPKNISIHEGLSKITNQKIDTIDQYLTKLNQLEKNILGMDVLTEDKKQILNAILALRYTLDYAKTSFDLTQVLSTTQSGHTENTRAFALRDETSLDNYIFDFINSASNDSEISFIPLVNMDLNEKETPQNNLILDFWQQSHQIFNEFYNHGKRMTDSHHADHDIRMRINDLFSAINTAQLNAKSSAKIKKEENQAQSHTQAQKPLRAKPIIAHYSPEIKHTLPVQIKQSTKKEKHTPKK